VIGRLFERKEAAAREQTAKLTIVLLVSSSSEDLEGDDPGCRESLVTRQGLSDTTIRRATGGSLELDPRRAVDEDHDAET
jgi:hypothetical protein